MADRVSILGGSGIDKKSPIPMYVQLKEIIRTSIDEERLAPNVRIPSEHDLSAEFNVSRMTVRQAIRELVNEGYVYVRKGEGMFVGCRDRAQMLVKLDGFSTEMTKQGHVVRSQVLAVAEVRDADAYRQAYAGLEERPGGALVMIERVRYLDGEPFALERSYLSFVNGGELLRREFDETFSIYRYLAAERQITLARAEHAVEPRLADGETARALGIAVGSPMLSIRGTTYAVGGRPVEYLEGAYRGDRYRFKVSIVKEGEAFHG